MRLALRRRCDLVAPKAVQDASRPAGDGWRPAPRSPVTTEGWGVDRAGGGGALADVSPAAGALRAVAGHRSAD